MLVELDVFKYPTNSWKHKDIQAFKETLEKQKHILTNLFSLEKI